MGGLRLENGAELRVCRVVDHIELVILKLVQVCSKEVSKLIDVFFFNLPI